MRQVEFALFDTAIGRCAIAWTARGIAALQLPEADDAAVRARMAARFESAREREPDGDAARAVRAIAAHLAGSVRDLRDVALDWTGVPAFHSRVLEALRHVPPGETIGYGELAARAGSPGAARAVGQAVGRNPFAVVVPCHRVLAAGGKPGGFSAHGGVATKRTLLAIEGVQLEPERTPTPSFEAREAIAHLSSRDARMADLIARVGPLALRVERTQSTFEALAESIVYQQLTGKAARTIHDRMRVLFPRKRVAPEGLLALRDRELRGAGLSRGKVAALRDLAEKTIDGTVPRVGALRAMEDDAIVDRLVRVRGIGRWTVEMLLIFRLGRPDVLPVGDYGVRHGFQIAYRKRALPTPKELARHGEKWRPFRTAASWYLWRAVDLARKREGAGRARA